MNGFWFFTSRSNTNRATELLGQAQESQQWKVPQKNQAMALGPFQEARWQLQGLLLVLNAGWWARP